MQKLQLISFAIMAFIFYLKHNLLCLTLYHHLHIQQLKKELLNYLLIMWFRTHHHLVLFLNLLIVKGQFIDISDNNGSVCFKLITSSLYLSTRLILLSYANIPERLCSRFQLMLLRYFHLNLPWKPK